MRGEWRQCQSKAEGAAVAGVWGAEGPSSLHWDPAAATPTLAIPLAQRTDSSQSGGREESSRVGGGILPGGEVAGPIFQVAAMGGTGMGPGLRALGLGGQ